MKKVLVAMSGGVDSSTTAVLLKEKGYEVIGITMKLFSKYEESFKSEKVCCTSKDSMDAKDVAYKYNFEHYTTNMEMLFQKFVINYFLDEYKKANTPNPCIMCNRYLKFTHLFEKTNLLDCEYLATGHYAKIIKEDGIYYIAKGKDLKKDQSYFLFNIPKYVLPKIIFPLGELTKEDVRKTAHSFNISCADKSESQDICFVSGDNYRNFIKTQEGFEEKKGNIILKNGTILGKHKGYFNYTIGQRKGLGIGYKEPLYVLNLDADKNLVIVGTKKEGYSTEFKAKSPSIFNEKFFDGKTKLDIYFWYKAKPVKGLIKFDKNIFYGMLEEPFFGITPGQAVVAYYGDKIVGGGWIF